MEVITRMTEVKRTKNIPLLPLRGLLVYPTMVLHIDVGRERSVAALEHAMLEDNLIFLVTQKEMSIENPTLDDLYTVGTVAYVKQMLKLPNGTIRVLVEGLNRAKVVDYRDGEEFAVVEIENFEDSKTVDAETEALMRTLLTYFEKYSKASSKVTTETYDTVADIEEPGRFADMVASYLPLKINGKQEILKIIDVKERLEILIQRLHDEQEVLNLEKKIGSKVKRAMEKAQKEFYLREQMKAIQTELGDREGKTGEVSELKKKIQESGMPESTLKAAYKELDRYEKLPAAAAESGVIRSYIDWLVALPWKEKTEDRHDIKMAEKVLNRDHEGLDKVKERILEYLSVRQLKQSLRELYFMFGGASWSR